MQPGRPAPPSPALSAALSRAVDLSALKAPPRPAAGAPADGTDEAAGPAAATGEVVIDVTEATFQTEVIDRSFETPVVLDLWADWCGPCKQLSPVLEKLAGEGGGSWILAKIDVDRNPAIAQALRVQGIPAVKAVFQGKLIAEFTGALPEPQVRQFVSAVVDAVGGAGQPGPIDGEAAEEPDDPRVVAAEDAVARGELADAARRYREILAAEPAHPRAADALREVELLQRVQSGPADAPARADAAPDDLDAQLAAADAEVAEDRVESAFRRLLDAVRRFGGADRERARTRLVELFGVVGNDDPRVSAARRDLSRALF